MKKSTYIFILVLFATNFYDLHPVADLLSGNGGVNGLVVFFLWMFLGVRLYKHQTSHDLYNKHSVAPALWILFGVFLSMIPAYLYWGQSLGTSIVAYRAQYSWLVIPLLLYIRPSTEEIIRPLNLFAVLYILSAIVRTYIEPQLFLISEETIDRISRGDYESEVLFGAGLPLLLFPLYYYVGKMREKMSLRGFLPVVLYVLVFYFIQNRSTLFVVIVVICYAILTNHSKSRYALVMFSILLAIIFVFQTMETWRSLFDETFSQLNDEDYNRVKAFNYFIYGANKHWITYILGNGFLSSKATSHMQDYMDMGIFNSDLGFVGYWNQYGIIPIIVFIVYIIKVFRSKACVFFVKAIGFHILACAMTISYFGNMANILWFALFYYLYVFYTQANQMEKE